MYVEKYNFLPRFTHPSSEFGQMSADLKYAV